MLNYSLGKMDPNWAKCLKSGFENFSRRGIIHACYIVYDVS